MAHVSHRLTSAFQGALAGGGDPATSPLYVFGPFLRLIVASGVAQITFGASVWLVVFTVVVVSAMYRQVMTWVTDGSGGSGLNEEEFGPWAVKLNAGITFIEYTLTFLVSMAALVTLTADRYPPLNEAFFGVQYRTLLAVVLSIMTGWLVNRGPRTAARAFGPATFGVLMLLWVMVIAAVWKFGLRLPDLNWRAFTPEYLHFTFGGYARLLALMTGIEIFANLVAAYEGPAHQRSRKAFGSLLIIMGTTSITMLVVGPAIFEVADPANSEISVFTQTMDRLLPSPLAYLGTFVGIVVLGSASAASAQGLQNLALGLRYRHYIPGRLGQRNRFDVADKPVWIEVAITAACFLVFGTHEETYLALYAAGVFVLLSMTGWAASKRLFRELRQQVSGSQVVSLTGTLVAASLTSAVTAIIFVERFFEGAWTYFVFIPVLYVLFSRFRARLGEPVPLEEHLGRLFVGQYLLPYQREGRPEQEQLLEDIVVLLDGSSLAEAALPSADLLARSYSCRLSLISATSVREVRAQSTDTTQSKTEPRDDLENYLQQTASQMTQSGLKVDVALGRGRVEEVVRTLSLDLGADLLVMTTHGRSGVERLFVSDLTNRIIQNSVTPMLLIRPTEEWRSRRTQFKHLLVSLDGSASAERALRYARSLARIFGSEIILLGVPETDAEKSRLHGYVAQVEAALRGRGLNARSIVTGSGPARTIVSVSEEQHADLIVIAATGRGSASRPASMGSVADRVTQTAQCPVLLVPGNY